MALNDISLTSGMRSNLLSLQNTVTLLNRTQGRLATGKKVNTAIDNPVSYFASQNLTSRASKIDSLKDAMGQAIQTITAADKGISAITTMIEQAKGIAQSALSAAAGATPDPVSGDATITVTYATSSVAALGGAADDSTIILGEGTDNEVTFTEGVDWDNTDNASDAGDALALAINTEGTYTAVNDGGVVTISLAGADFGVDDITGTAVVTEAAGQAHSEEFAFTVNTVEYTGTGATAALAAADLKDAIGAVDGVATATVSEAGAVAVTFELDEELPSAELTALQGQYNEMLGQISALAGDSGYKGKNLLDGNTMTDKFEGSTMDVVGFDASADGLGIAEATWTAGGDIDGDLTLLDAALDTLSQNASGLSGNLSIITVRQDFSTNMINTLTEGSDKLTLADTNEEGANMLMLQTRQSLATTALSLSAQAAQSVLQLFR